MNAGRAAPTAGACVLAGLSLLHLSWAVGSSWPAPDRHELAEVVAGRPELPGAAACVVVGGGLAVASLLVAGAGGDRPAARLARTAVAAGFLGRGVAGLTGTTGRLVRWSPSARFARLDRRYYGPLCVAIGLAAAQAASSRKSTPVS